VYFHGFFKNLAFRKKSNLVSAAAKGVTGGVADLRSDKWDIFVALHHSSVNC
jgi:hypothetical protein